MSYSTRSASRTPARNPRPQVDMVGVVFAGAVSAALVALIGIALGLISTMGSWALAAHSEEVGPDEVARVSVAMWLYAQHVPLELGGVRLGLVPLGLMLIPGLLCYAGGRQVARVVGPRTLGDASRAVIPYALVYALLASVAAGVVRSDIVQPAPRTAFFAGFFIALVAGGLGILRASGLLSTLIARVPIATRDMVASATAGLATVIVISAVLTALALAVAFPDAVESFRALGAGWSGGIALLLLTVSFIPNLVLWTASFTTGVGFAVGATGSVSPQGVDYGALPVFPPLAALPPEGHAGALAFVALIAPLLGGYAVGAVMHRRHSALKPEHVAGRAAVSGASAGLALGVLAWLSGGAAGNAAMSMLGPEGWKVALVAALEMALIAAVVSWELARRGGLHPPSLIDLRERAAWPELLAVPKSWVEQLTSRFQRRP
ncbi:MAG: DUF6350 family protein [Actinomycetes bacterium]